ncbi:MAG TPA: DinB family protein [Gemmatimonadaceae bacterium]|nr:DinB family protein [Gemmatimonadaceae bacterium]
MTSREFFLERRRAENPIFLNVMKSIPADRIDYKPHDRSPSTQQIMWTMTNELRSCIDAATQNRAEWKTDPIPPFDELQQLFEKSLNDLTSAVEKMDDRSWDRVAQFYSKGKVINEQPVGQFLWYILFDAIHHRGQLTAYLRPMGAKVPSIYGPSGDSRAG